VPGEGHDEAELEEDGHDAGELPVGLVEPGEPDAAAQDEAGGRAESDQCPERPRASVVGVPQAGGDGQRSEAADDEERSDVGLLVEVLGRQDEVEEAGGGE
jgi:hypothetical protein